MKTFCIQVLCALAVISSGLSVISQAQDDTFHDDFTAGLTHWRPYWEAKQWVAREGALINEGKAAESVLLADFPDAANVVVEADVRMIEAGTTNFGLAFRAEGALTFLLLRYDDQADALQLHRYRLGIPARVRDADASLVIMPGRWYRIKAAAIDDMILGKMWAVGAAEPGWQLRAPSADSSAGGVGLMTLDVAPVEFANVRIQTGQAMSELEQAWKTERAEYEKHLRDVLELQVQPTPLVLRHSEGPTRRIDVRALADGQPALVGGTLTLSYKNTRQTHSLTRWDFDKGTYQLFIPEPTAPVDIDVTLETTIGRTIRSQCTVEPARHWTFYMTEHTHYDVGFTGPQPVVIERLSRDMEAVVPFVKETAGWPEESRFKWTVEVSGLLKNFIERHTEAEVADFLDLVRQGSVEICGYYLNMPTELVGHEELIRCLYEAQRIRDKYNVPVDTAMIDDVPGYTWALPEVFVKAGIPRIAVRANSIHGQFLWYRDGAIPRPFYWQSPDGSRVFTWYTDSYREGNFWRNPGLQEKWFMELIARNEAAGCWVDHVQLRMGGDNLAPDLDVSRNVRAWNEKYLWPRTVVATNRDFLEAVEKQYGHQCQTFRGDIPSWWAEGPASSARETGINRLQHDRLVAAETLCTLARLADASACYPRDRINTAYDKMIHYDEHTWGASESVIAPNARNTRTQWAWKANYACDARKLTDRLQADALAQLAQHIPAPAKHSIAVWNTLSWNRTDVVELSLVDTPFAGVDSLTVIDTRTGQPAPAQITDHGTKAVFIARDVPSVGYVVFTIERSNATTENELKGDPLMLENAFYRVQASPEKTGLINWYDKRLDRELLDRQAAYQANQAIHEVPLGGRIAIDRKQPVQFTRTAAVDGSLIERTQGPVFQELVLETALPGCPRIEQTVRLYNELQTLDITNVVTKEEIFGPEGIYFAFPFDVPSPAVRFQIANAVMQAGRDQLPMSCYDFYSIQQWADVAGDDFGIIFAPLEAPLLSVSDLNVYKWADTITFDRGHLYSLVMNNYWFTNFRAGQGGQVPFRYRLTSYAGIFDAIRSTQLAWQPFYPLLCTWLAASDRASAPASESFIQIQGDPVIVSCMKQAETCDVVIIRMLEMRGEPSRCTLILTPPGQHKITRAFAANVVEVPQKPLAVSGNAVTVELRPHEVFTLGVELERP